MSTNTQRWRLVCLALAILGLGLLFWPRLTGEPLAIGPFTIAESGGSPVLLVVIVAIFLVAGWKRDREQRMRGEP